MIKSVLGTKIDQTIKYEFSGEAELAAKINIVDQILQEIQATLEKRIGGVVLFTPNQLSAADLAFRMLFTGLQYEVDKLNKEIKDDKETK